MNIVTTIPIKTVTTTHGNAEQLGDVGVEHINALLRSGAVRFVIADIGHPLEWVPTMECFSKWKNTIRKHIAEPTVPIYLQNFPDAYAYTASVWNDGETPIVLLSKHH